mgnify:CR=1 FL=1
MARKPKIDTGKLTNGQRAESTARAAEEPKSTSTKPKKSASRKKSVRTNVPTASKAMATSGYEPTDEEIAVRAYFIAERRLQLALDGDSDQDWLEARRQLVEEANR